METIAYIKTFRCRVYTCITSLIRNYGSKAKRLYSSQNSSLFVFSSQCEKFQCCWMNYTDVTASRLWLHTRYLMCPLDEHHCSRKPAQSCVKCDCRPQHQVSTYQATHNPASDDSVVLRYNQSVKHNFAPRNCKFSKKFSPPLAQARSMPRRSHQVTAVP